MAEAKSERWSPSWGIVAVAVLVPAVTKVITHWLPLHYAAAIANFVMCYAAFWTFTWTPPRTWRGMVARLAIAGTAGVAAGLIGFWFP